MNLIRQNNRLIERITQLEKERNLLYIDSLNQISERNHISNYDQQE